MPRAIWNGVITFGLVNISVKLYTAVSRKAVRFNQIDARTGSRIRQKRFSAADDTEVPAEQIVKGYEIGAGEYVIVEDDELAALDPAAQRTIEIEEFVDLVEIDPIFYDAAYHVAPGPQMAKPYRLLVEAMTTQDKVAIAHFVMRTKQYVAALRPVEDRLVLSTMIYADEIVDPAEIPELDEVAEVEVNPRELTMATQLIDSLAGDWQPERYHDTHREQVLALIQQKAAGENVIQAFDAELPPTNVIDLISALEASIAERKGSRDRHPTALSAGGASTGDRPGDADADEDEDEDAPPPAMKPARSKRSTSKTSKRAPARKKTTNKAPKKAATATGSRAAPSKTGTSKTGTSKTGTSKTGTSKTGTSKTGTPAKKSTAKRQRRSA